MASVARYKLDLRKEPRDDAPIIGKRYHDRDHAHLRRVPHPEEAPGTRCWSRVWGGSLHSAYLQRVTQDHNPALARLPEAGKLVRGDRALHLRLAVLAQGWLVFLAGQPALLRHHPLGNRHRRRPG